MAAPNYSLYLVTGRELLPAGKDYYESLDETLREGKVTMVQVREKHIDNGDFLELASKTLEICDRHGVTMLVNDNIAVALALPERVGVHIGQDDLPLDRARQLLGPKRLLGISVKNVDQARKAREGGFANYAGVGPVYPTLSKAGIAESDALGPRGARAVVEALGDLPCVLIGGINQKTAARALFGTTGVSTSPAGIAVISAIVARPDPGKAAVELGNIVAAHRKGLEESGANRISAFGGVDPVSASSLTSSIASLLSSRSGSPVIQTLTSHVSANFSANVALAFRSSPIMSQQHEEAEDLGNINGAVVLNIGTIGPEARRGMRAVGGAANRNGRPVVLDPVGVGASAFRKAAVEEIMNHTQITLLKGNAAELSSIAGLSEVASRGVDSGSGQLSDPVGLVRSLAQRERCLVLLSGKEDYLSDGRLVVRSSNGHELLGRVTGTGCALGVTVAAGMAFACELHKQRGGEAAGGLGGTMVKARPEELFVGALTGLLSWTIASELAAQRPDVKGPGTFIPALLDELANLTPETLAQRAKLDVVS